MKTTPVTFTDLANSVIAVPPLARHADHSVNWQANQRLIQHLEKGGVSSILYGGNANFYHLGLSGYADLVDGLAERVGDETWLIPSVGPSYGLMMDQAAILRERDFPTIMVLPLQAPMTPAGVEAGLRHVAERFGRPIVLYLKAEGYLSVEGVKHLVEDGLVSAIKYAVVRADPANDPYLQALCDSIDPRYLVSGIGERPAIVHLRDFGLTSFTSGSVCLAPRLSTQLLQALKRQDDLAAEDVRRMFLPLEDLRDGIHPVRVLHDAVSLADIADMGPILPLLHNLEEGERERVASAARDLLAHNSLRMSA